jgi:hypothetical protein
MSTFHVTHNASFSCFIACLSDEQRNAISSIKVDHTKAYMAGIWVEMVQRLANLAALQTCECELEIWKLKMGFRTLSGLRKIGVHQGDPEYTNVYLQGLRDGVQAQKVDIVLEESG